MAFVQSHQEIARHPKTYRLAKRLGLPRLHTVGIMHGVWWWCLSYAQDGDVTDFVEDIETEVEWEGGHGALMDAFVESGLVDEVDGRLLVHDWEEYAGRLIQLREANAARMREARARQQVGVPKERATHVQRTYKTRVRLENRIEEKRREENTGGTRDSVAVAEATPPKAKRVRKKAEDDPKVVAMIAAIRAQPNEALAQWKPSRWDVTEIVKSDYAPHDVAEAYGAVLDGSWPFKGKPSLENVLQALPAYLTGRNGNGIKPKAAMPMSANGKFHTDHL